MDRRNAAATRSQRLLEPNRLTIEQDLARLVSVHAGDDLDQCALTSTVGAGDNVHLACLEAQ